MEREGLGVNIRLGREGGGEDLGRIIGEENKTKTCCMKSFKAKLKDTSMESFSGQLLEKHTQWVS